MGLSGEILHLLARVSIQAIVVWIALVVFLGIPLDKVGPVLMISFIASIVSQGLASLLIGWHSR